MEKPGKVPLCCDPADRARRTEILREEDLEVPAAGQSRRGFLASVGNTVAAMAAFASGRHALANGNYNTGMHWRNLNGVWIWGDGAQGELGMGNTQTTSRPIQIGQSWVQVAMGGDNVSGNYFTLARAANGTLWAFGKNGSGQLGIGSTLTKSSPVQVPGSWTQVAAGAAHALGIKSDGTLWAWGNDADGELGQNSSGTNHSSPIQVGSATNWTKVFAGGVNSGTSGASWAINSLGQLFAWGSDGGNNFLGLTGGASSPVQITAGTGSWTMVGGCDNDCGTLFLQNDGTLWGAGCGCSGELWGASGTIQQLGTATSWRQVTTGNASVYAIDDLGQLWAWATSKYVGVVATSPTQIPGSWTQVTAGGSWFSGYEFGIGIKTDGTMWAWGSNARGQLAQGNTTAKSTLTQIPGSWTQVQASSLTSSVFAWRVTTP